MGTQLGKRRSSCSRSPSPSTKRHRTTSSTESVRFLIISDTHDSILPSYPECDVVLHCGDLTEDGSPSSISAALQVLENVKAELKLVIAGNHEISLDRDYYLAEGGTDAAHQQALSLVARPGSDAEKSGVTYLDEGTHEFTLTSGAHFRVYTSQWTPKHGSSAFQYPTSDDRFNPTSPEWANNIPTKQSLIPNNVDIVMTHGPPKYILDDTGDGRSAGCEHLRRAIARVKPRLHCFGHIHKGYGAQRVEFDTTKAVKDKKTGDEFDPIVSFGKEWVGPNQSRRKGYASLSQGSAEAFRTRDQTLLVNASIVNEDGKSLNAPWIVELDLPSDISRD